MKHTRFFTTLIWLISLLSLSVQAQDSIYTFPFHMDSKLLVFTGEMNGVPTQFAFDTGASMGLANSQSASSGRLKIKGKKMKITDSNLEVQKIPTGVSDEIKIGEFKFEKVKSLVNDMAFLACMDFYLLGADIISQLNWEIDFEKQLIRVSKTPFPTEDMDTSFPVVFRNNRPFTQINFSSVEFKNMLIDFGYTQVIDFPSNFPLAQPFISKKDSLRLSNPNISTSMGALGSKTYTTKTILVDSLKVGDAYFSQIPVDFEENSTAKIGLKFFSGISSKTILNHSDSLFYLKLRPEPNFGEDTQIGLQFNDGKIVLSGKPLGLTSDDSKIEIGEEILEVNGVKMEGFSNECDFLKWYVSHNPEQIELTKLDGTQLTFPKIKLK